MNNTFIWAIGGLLVVAVLVITQLSFTLRASLRKARTLEARIIELEAELIRQSIRKQGYAEVGFLLACRYKDLPEPLFKSDRALVATLLGRIIDQTEAFEAKVAGQITATPP